MGQSTTFDANGNVSGETSDTTDNPHGDNQVVSTAAGWTDSYDANGNLIAQILGDGMEIEYKYNFRNQLTQVIKEDLSDGGEVKTQTEVLDYFYDMYGHLIGRTDDLTYGATTTEHFAFDGANPVLAFDGKAESGTGPILVT